MQPPSAVSYEPYDAGMLQELLDDFRQDHQQRDIAMNELRCLHDARLATGAGDGDSEVVRLQAWLMALTKMSVRHEVVELLDAALPVSDARGRRTQYIGYAHKAGGYDAGRLYAQARWQVFADGQLRSATLQGMPGDLRAKLTGFCLVDIDGVASDMHIYVILSRAAGFADSEVDTVIGYIERRDTWHERVAKHYCTCAGWASSAGTIAELCAKVKRWPNAIGNGAGHAKLLTTAGLPNTCQEEPSLLQPMMTQLRRLKAKLLAATCNAVFDGHHRARIAAARPMLSSTL